MADVYYTLALDITVKSIDMGEKLVVKILMIAGNIAAVISALVVLYNLGAAIFDSSDLKAYAAIDRIPIGIASFLSSVVLIGFAYIVKHVCEVKD